MAAWILHYKTGLFPLQQQVICGHVSGSQWMSSSPFRIHYFPPPLIITACLVFFNAFFSANLHRRDLLTNKSADLKLKMLFFLLLLKKILTIAGCFMYTYGILPGESFEEVETLQCLHASLAIAKPQMSKPSGNDSFVCCRCSWLAGSFSPSSDLRAQFLPILTLPFSRAMWFLGSSWKEGEMVQHAHRLLLCLGKRHPSSLTPFMRVNRVASPGCRKGWDIDSFVVTTFQDSSTLWERKHIFSQTVLPLLSWLVGSLAGVMSPPWQLGHCCPYFCYCLWVWASPSASCCTSCPQSDPLRHPDPTKGLFLVQPWQEPDEKEKWMAWRHLYLSRNSAFHQKNDLYSKEAFSLSSVFLLFNFLLKLLFTFFPHLPVTSPECDNSVWHSLYLAFGGKQENKCLEDTINKIK